MRAATDPGAVIALLALAACQIREPFPCTLDEHCGPTGRCEPAGYCSFPDVACADGRRYDDHARDDLSGQCVALQCPPSYTATLPGSSSRYRPVNQPVPWLAAQTDCADDGAGTHLIVVGSDLERTGIDTLLDDHSWIGFSDRITENTFRWVTSPPSPFTAWAPGRPSDFNGTEDCTEQRRGNSDWHDEPCDELYLYLCECDGIAPDPSAY